MSSRYYAPRFDIRISGVTLSADITNQVTSVSYDNNLDIADMFTIVIRNADNHLLDSALFDLGKSVEIYMGYGDELQPMMLGEITSLQPSFPGGGAPTLTVSGYDKSYRLRHNEVDRPSFRFQNDSAIAAQIAVEAGLIPVVDPTRSYHRNIPHTGSDMSFLKKLAQANFFDVYVHWDKLYFRLPRPQTEAYVLEWGKNLSSFNPRLSSAGMTGIQIIRGYNEELAQTIVGIAMAPDINMDNIIEKLGGSAFDLLVGLGRQVIRDQPVKSPFDATTIARSILQEILEGLYEGNGSCIGIPELRADTFVSIQGIGKRFSGKYRLRKVTHSIDDSGYRTSFEVTQRSSSTLLGMLRKSVVDLPSPNRQEKFFGVAVGKVVDNVDSAPNLGRVRLTFPWLSDFNDSDWARIATPMAGKQTGFYFLPDIGDEVLVAFEHGDLSKPVVLGGMWNGDNQPPVTHSDRKNRIRMIKTAGHTITFDDTKGDEKMIIDDGKMGAARTGDTVASAAAMTTWIGAVSTALGITVPTDFGQITGGSVKVKIG